MREEKQEFNAIAILTPDGPIAFSKGNLAEHIKLYMPSGELFDQDIRTSISTALGYGSRIRKYTTCLKTLTLVGRFEGELPYLVYPAIAIIANEVSGGRMELIIKPLEKSFLCGQEYSFGQILEYCCANTRRKDTLNAIGEMEILEHASSDNAIA